MLWPIFLYWGSFSQDFTDLKVHLQKGVWKNYAKRTKVTHSEAVNNWLPLVASSLMELSWPWTSPRGTSESACQSRSRPPRHPLISTEEPGTMARALTQSACALAHCWTRQFIFGNAEKEFGWWRKCYNNSRLKHLTEGAKTRADIGSI